MKSKFTSLARRHPDRVPRVDLDGGPGVFNGSNRIGPKLVGVLDGQVCEFLERRARVHGADFRVEHGVVPDLSRLFPGVAAEGGGDEEEGAVGDARVQVHAAAVVAGFWVVSRREELPVPVHVAWLAVPARDGRVAVRRARVRHVAQRACVGDQEEASSDQPVGAAGVLLGDLGVLLDQGAEDVGQGFVERARLVFIHELRGRLGDAVRELVRRDVDDVGEAAEDLAVAVAVGHDLVEEERVEEPRLAVLVVVDRPDQLLPAPVDRVPAQHLVVEIIGLLELVVHVLGTLVV